MYKTFRPTESMRLRIIEQFLSKQNKDYLRGLFSRKLQPKHLNQLEIIMYDFSRYRALEIIASDPISVRGAIRPAVDFWSEIKRLNGVFYEETLKSFNLNPFNRAEDNESYAMRMFTADSLRPPGLTQLNNPGPLYELNEDQALPLGDDEAWREGKLNRTAEQALAEYYGDDKSATTLEFVEQKGVVYGDKYSWGERWKENGGSRFMRYETIPFWQKGGREGYDHDINESLGMQSKELGAHVRGWDMSKLYNPPEYKIYGARTSK